MRDAVVSGDSESVAAYLMGGGRPSKRFDIHRRHYEDITIPENIRMGHSPLVNGCPPIRKTSAVALNVPTLSDC
jgi:hypothetical protein